LRDSDDRPRVPESSKQSGVSSGHTETDRPPLTRTAVAVRDTDGVSVVELLHGVHLVGVLVGTAEQALRLLTDRLLACVDYELGRDLG